MTTIQIDDEVLAYLKQHVSGFGETPNTVIRRLLELDPPETPATSTPPTPTNPPQPGKLPDLKMSELIKVGKLKEGQSLYFRSTPTSPNGKEAKVQGDKLLLDGELLTTTGATRKLKNAEGDKGYHFRGPDFWFTAEGEKLTRVWRKHMGFPVKNLS